jgi:hypothetical protein
VIDKLGACGITTHDARQIPRNAHIVVRNPHKTAPGKRRLLIGRTDGGSALTLVIEQTAEPTTWLIVTGWDPHRGSVNCSGAEHGARSLDRR